MRAHPACPVILTLAVLAGFAPLPAKAAECFAASKIYVIRPLHGGHNARDGWSVEGNAFAQCVKRAEAADKKLHARYPDSAYGLLPAATVGCHAPCN